MSESSSLDILWEDAHLLAVNKPAGVSTQAPLPGIHTLEKSVRAYLRPDDPAAAYLGTVHRLDRPVSGAILFAKTEKAARRASAHFQHRRVEKVYWAVVERTAPGIDLLDDLVWEDYLSPPGERGLVQVVSPGVLGARVARTRVRSRHDSRSRRDDGLLLLTLLPETGRTHQLRVQAASRGFPIVGDLAYGSRHEFAGVIALHARSLTLRHPILQSELSIVAPTPESWARFRFEVE